MRVSCAEQDERSNLLTDKLCWTYVPLTSQAFFRILPSRLKGFSGPVGSGKSAALCFESVRNAYVNRGRQGVLAAPTFAMLRDATLTSLLRMMDECDVEFEMRKADGELTVMSPE